MSYNRKDLSVIDLETGAVHPIKDIPGRAAQVEDTWPHEASWSPDGKWISAVLQNKEIILVDSTDTTRRRKLGRSDGPPAVWSPDSKFLLVPKSELRCTMTLYFESLEVIDITSGERRVIPSSHCGIGGGWFGWVDAGLVR